MRYFFRLLARGVRLVLISICLVGAVVGLQAAVAMPALGLLVLAVVVWRVLRRPLPLTGAFGYARFAEFLDLVVAGTVLTRYGVLVGRAGGARLPSLATRLRLLFTWPWAWSQEVCFLAVAPSRGLRRAFVRLPDFVHGVVVAPPGRGKSRCVAIPVLLDYRGSVFVLDIKGELFRICAGHRYRRFGRPVYVIDPFGMTGYPSVSVNPLDWIDRDSPTALDHCRILAAAMVVITAHEQHSHWPESARVFITAAIAVVAAHAPSHERNLQSAREILTDPKRFAAAIKIMQGSDAFGGMLRRLGHRLTQYIDRELGSTLTTTNRFMDYLDSVSIAAVTSQSTFRFEDVIAGRADLFVVVPPEQLVPQANFLRLLTTGMYLAQTRYGTEQTPVLYVLDEIGNLGGSLESLEHALTIGRSFGVRLLLFFQSLGQIRTAFPEKEGIVLSCLDTHVYFGLNDHETAAFVSSRLGNATVHTVNSQSNGGRSYSYPRGGGQGGGSSSYSTGWSSGASETGRSLLFADEIARLPDGTAILFHRNHLPALIELAPHDQAPELWGNGGEVGGARWVAAKLLQVIVAAALLMLVVFAGRESPGR